MLANTYNIIVGRWCTPLAVWCTSAATTWLFSSLDPARGGDGEFQRYRYFIFQFIFYTNCIYTYYECKLYYYYHLGAHLVICYYYHKFVFYYYIVWSHLIYTILYFILYLYNRTHTYWGNLPVLDTSKVNANDRLIAGFSLAHKTNILTIFSLTGLYNFLTMFLMMLKIISFSETYKRWKQNFSYYLVFI